MDRELTRAELDELLAAYALDALDGDEREQVERYVARDEGARAEVASLREAASLLPYPAASAPPSLWSRIEESLGPPTATGREPPPAPLVVPVAVARTRPVRRRLLVAGLAAAALVAIVTIVVLGVEVAHERSRVDDLAAAVHHDTMVNRARAAKAVPGAQSVMLTAADPTHSAEVVLLPDGTGYLLDANLPELAPGRTYQLWVETGTPQAHTMISAGVLGRAASATPFRVMGPVMGFAVTAEPAPGARTPTSAPVLRGDMA